jgi:BlaI family transcriptional regulator, penicillinase repressor
MVHRRLDRPTNAELAILRVLWERGASTVREVHEALTRREPVGYTTTLKLLQIMVEKKLASRTEEGRMHRYKAAAKEADTQKRLVADLVERAFGGSMAGLVQQALSSRPASDDELVRIRELIDRAQKEKR